MSSWLQAEASGLTGPPSSQENPQASDRNVHRSGSASSSSRLPPQNWLTTPLLLVQTCHCTSKPPSLARPSEGDKRQKEDLGAGLCLWKASLEGEALAAKRSVCGLESQRPSRNFILSLSEHRMGRVTLQKCIGFESQEPSRDGVEMCV